MCQPTLMQSGKNQDGHVAMRNGHAKISSHIVAALLPLCCSAFKDLWKNTEHLTKKKKTNALLPGAKRNNSEKL